MFVSSNFLLALLLILLFAQHMLFYLLQIWDKEIQVFVYGIMFKFLTSYV